MAHNLRRSLLISFSQSYVNLALQFVSSIIIARLLTPHELGIFSVAMVLIALVNTLRDFGIVNYIIQEPDLNERRIRAATGVTLVAGWSIALFVFLMAGLAADFYRQSGVADVMRILAINFLLLPFGSISMAYMRREMMLERIAFIRVVAAVTQSGLAIALAWLGWSYLSMAWSAVITTLLQIAMIYALRPKKLSTIPSFHEMTHVLRFSTLSVVSDIIRTADKGAPDATLGRLMGMAEVAFFSRAYGLVDIFNRVILESISYVALPHFSSKVRAGEDITLIYLRSITLLTGLSWPFFVWLAAAAPSVVPLLYGDQWHASVPLVQMLCLGEILLAPFQLLDQLLIAQGRLKLEIVRLVIMLAVRLLPFLLLPPYGLEVVAVGYALSNLLVVAFFFYIVQHYLGFSVAEVVRALTPSVAPMALVAILLGALVHIMPAEMAQGTLALGLYSVVSIVATLFGQRLSGHPLYNELGKAGKLFHLWSR